MIFLLKTRKNFEDFPETSETFNRSIHPIRLIFNIDFCTYVISRFRIPKTCFDLIRLQKTQHFNNFKHTKLFLWSVRHSFAKLKVKPEKHSVCKSRSDKSYLYGHIRYCRPCRLYTRIYLI